MKVLSFKSVTADGFHALLCPSGHGGYIDQTFNFQADMITDPPYKILIVDDNDDILSTFCEFFNPVEYSIDTAGNGLDALKKIKKDKKEFDVLITDLIMPGIGGVGLISIIKKEYPNMKIIAMTGWGDQPGSLASEAKADVVLFKPVDLFKIEKLLVQLIEGHVDKE